MPVFVINADPTFDMPGIARREGLDLFKDQRLQLIDALRHQPHNPQVERLWDDWPPLLEGNRNNLRAEIERILAAAAVQRDQDYVILFVLSEFAPANASQHVSRELLIHIRQMIQGRDRNDQGLETASSTPNIWVLVFLRPPQDPELMAQRAIAENRDLLVNNIFVSVFDGHGRDSDRPASDFLTIRILAELLLNNKENRRFLQVVQNAYTVTCIIGPSRLPSGGASHLLSRALNGTLNELEEHNAPAAGSTAISMPAVELKRLVAQLVARAKEGVDVGPTADTGTADLMTAKLLDVRQRPAAEQGKWAAMLSDVVAVGRRPLDGFAGLRMRLDAEIEREHSEHDRQRETWTRLRTDKLKSFSGFNVDIGKAINAISKAAVGSRGNDIKVIEELMTDVGEERKRLKTIAQGCRASMSAADDETGFQQVHAARRAFDFELDQVPQWRSILYYATLSSAAAALPFLVLIWSGTPHWLPYLILASLLTPIVLVACVYALVRRHRKMTQAASDLREQLEKWRKRSADGFNQALLYQTSTLAIGWLTSIVENLQQIKRSIELRSEALQDCRDMLGTNTTLTTRMPESDDRTEALITANVARLRTFNWDKWIMEFLGTVRVTDVKANAEVVLADDGQTLTLAVPGLEEPVRATIRTPQKVS
jgi:hypothetical protein